MPTVTTDIINPSASAIVYSMDNEKWTVTAGRVVYGNADAAHSTMLNSTLVNFGHMVGESTGVEFTHGAIRNQAGASIFGDINGISFTGAKSVLTNAGTIGGGSIGVDFTTSADNVSVQNSGRITGAGYGVYQGSLNDGGTIVNSGQIVSPNFAGLWVSTAPGLVTQVTNQAGGVIGGTFAAIFYSSPASGALDLKNAGIIRGKISINDANIADDKIVNTGRIAGATDLGAGNDKFNGMGGRQAPVFGEAGDDRLAGGALSDRFDGGEGRDFLTGRGGKDTFVFASGNDSAVGPLRDLITDFSKAQHDKIEVGAFGITAFQWNGTAALSGGGTASLNYTKHNLPGTANDRTIIHGDADGDGTADFEIGLKGLHNLGVGDLVLFA